MAYIQRSVFWIQNCFSDLPPNIVITTYKPSKSSAGPYIICLLSTVFIMAYLAGLTRMKMSVNKSVSIHFHNYRGFEVQSSVCPSIRPLTLNLRLQKASPPPNTLHLLPLHELEYAVIKIGPLTILLPKSS